MNTRPATMFAAPCRRALRAAVALAAVPLLALAAVSAPSSIGGSYEVDAQVVGAGGATLTGASGLTTDAVVGQNNAATLTGANGYSATTGFWSVAVRGGASDRVFLGTFEPAGP